MNKFAMISNGGSSPCVDIVFVHGLGGDARKTWINKDTNYDWLEQSLAKDIPNARIMSYGYDTKRFSLRKALSTNTLELHAETFIRKLSTARLKDEESKRKIIFIAHSLGGLLTAQALRISDDGIGEQGIKQIVSCTIGLVFFGVPFRGSGLAGSAKIITSVLGYLGVGTVNKNILGVLAKKSRFREDLREFLNNLIRTGPREMSMMLCVIEELKKDNLTVVSQVSGSLPFASIITSSKSHPDLATFEHKFDKEYVDIRDGYLKGWLKTHQLHVETSFTNSRGEDEDKSNDDGQKRSENGDRERAESSVENENLLRQVDGQSPKKRLADEDGRGLVIYSQRKKEGENKERPERVIKEDGLEKQPSLDRFSGRINIQGQNQTFNGGTYFGTVNQHNHYAPIDEEPPTTLNTIPATSETHFTDRQKLLDNIERACEANRPQAASRTALQGLGGIGKSTLAVAYGNRFIEKNPKKHWVLWVDADSKTNLKDSFKDIARQLKIRGRNKPDVDHFQIVCETMRDVRDMKWLLIFDNVDDLTVFNQPELERKDMQENNLVSKKSEPWLKCFPQNPKGSILITSRCKTVTNAMIKLPDETIIVESMTEEEALALFREKSLKTLRICKYEEAARKLLNELGLIPLAIVQAASYIRQEFENYPDYSIEKYLGEFLEYAKDKENGPRWDKDARKIVFATWKLSLDRMKERRPSAVKLLYLMSCFDRQGIPKVGLSNPAVSKDERLALREFYVARGHEIKNNAYQDDELEDDIQLLRNYSFISSTEDNYYQMHPLVHSAVNEWLNDAGSLAEWIKQQFIHNLVLAFLFRDVTYEHIYPTLLPHLNVALNQRPSSDVPLEEWSRLMYYSARCAYKLGSYSDAERFSEVVIVSNGAAESQDLALAKCCYISGNIWQFREDLEKSEQRYEKAADIFERIGEEQVPNLLTTLKCLVASHGLRESQETAKNYREKILRIHNSSGDKYNNNKTYLLAVGKMYSDLGKLDDARSNYEKVLSSENQDATSVIDVKLQIAITYVEDRNWIESQKHLEDALTVVKETGTLYRPKSLDIVQTLAFVLKQLNQHEEAFSLIKECLEIQGKVLGPENFYTLITLQLFEKWKDEGLQSLNQCSVERTLLDFVEVDKTEKEEEEEEEEEEE